MVLQAELAIPFRPVQKRRGLQRSWRESEVAIFRQQKLALKITTDLNLNFRIACVEK